MKADFNQPIKDLDGKDIVERRSQNGVVTEVPVTYSEMVTSILLNGAAEQEVLTAQDKLRRYAISMKIYGAKHEAQLSVDEVAFVLEKAGKYASVLVYGRLKELLDPGAGDDGSIQETQEDQEAE